MVGSCLAPPFFFCERGRDSRNCPATGAWAPGHMGRAGTLKQGANASGLTQSLIVNSCRVTMRVFFVTLGICNIKSSCIFTIFNYVIFRSWSRLGDAMCTMCGWVSGGFSLLDFADGIESNLNHESFPESNETHVCRAKNIIPTVSSHRSTCLLL